MFEGGLWIRTLWLLAGGYVVIKVEGPNIEGWINQCAGTGVPLFAVQRVASDLAIVRVRADSFARACRAGRGMGLRIHTIEKHGAPFWLQTLGRRPFWTLGAIGALIGLYVLSSFIWFVQVDGLTGERAAGVLTAAADAGLKPGAYRKALDLPEVARKILIARPDLSWASVSVQGTHATITVAGKLVADGNADQPGDLIATRDGIVERLIVLQGNARVAVGATVKRGQVLISGALPPDSEAYATRVANGEAPYVRARGIVDGRVWYEATAAVALYERRQAPTGRQATRWTLGWGSHRLSWGARQPFADEHQEEQTYAWSAFGFQFPVTLRSVKYAELKATRVTRSVAEATAAAQEAAKAQLASQLQGDGAEQLGEPKSDCTLSTDSKVICHIMVEARESIIAFRALPRENKSENGRGDPPA